MSITSSITSNIISNVTSSIVAGVGDPDAGKFISTWKTDNAGTSNNDQVSLPLESVGTYDFTVDWGDGTSDTITVWNQAETTHTYSVAGTYTINITGQCEGWGFNNGGDKSKLLEVKNWGTSFRLGNSNSYFFGCNNLTITATDILNFSGTIDCFQAFRACASIINIPNINNWNVSSVTDMNSMFRLCTNFASDVSGWDVSSVTDMRSAFNGCTNFASDVSGWNVSSVTDMNSMFRLCTNFASDVSGWDVSNVTDMNSMFRACPNFTSAVNNWDVSNVTDMNSMFRSCTNFASDISGWDVSNVTDMTNLLNGTSFSQTNYDLLLVAWEAQLVQNNVPFHAGAAKYGAGAPATARAALIADHNWTITDGGPA